MQHLFIIGAQKSATSAIASALSNHRDVCLSRPKEPMYFSYDDPLIHPHFFIKQRTPWKNLPWHTNADPLAQYHQQHFAHYQGEKWLVDASTSYLPSRVAAERISRLFSGYKIILLIRDPVERAYSAYWHYVNKQATTESFQNHLQYENGLTLHMGEYKRHIQAWLKFVPKDKFKVIRFEDIISDPESVLRRLCAYLDIEYSPDLIALKKVNVTPYPLSLRLKLMCNRMRRNARDPSKILTTVLDKIDAYNMQRKHCLKMDEALEDYLQYYFKVKNAGLDELLSSLDGQAGD